MKDKTKQTDAADQKVIVKDLLHIGEYFSSTKLSEVIEFLQEQEEKFTKEGFSNLQLKFEWDGRCSPYHICIYGECLETDSVYYERLAQYQKQLEKNMLKKQKQEEQNRKKAQEEMESELALLAKLKEKYES